MFSSENKTKNIPVKITLSDQSVHSGNIVIGMGSTLTRTLNGDSRFLEFVDISGTKRFFAVSSLVDITPINAPKEKKLEEKSSEENSFDPYRTLNIAPQSDFETVQAAYYSCVKQYHPDRFTGCELPLEMKRFADNKIRLINAAFDMLKNTGKSQFNNDAPSNRAANF